VGRDAAEQAALYLERKEAGVCVRCGGERDAHGLRCASCVEQQRQKHPYRRVRQSPGPIDDLIADLQREDLRL
jgi:predicted amidophosphoribosyltransferase